MQHVALACGYIAAAVKPGLPVARSTNRRSGAKATAADHDLTEAVVGNPVGGLCESTRHPHHDPPLTTETSRCKPSARPNSSTPCAE